MTVAWFEVTQFRCIERARLDVDPECTLIVGENASGKTSLLEALFFLGSGRSFRSPQLDVLIRTGCDHFSVVGRVDALGSAPATLGVRTGRSGSEIRLGGRPATGFAEMAAALPVQVIDPEVHGLLEGGPSERRRFMDWGVFHVEQGFIGCSRRYQRALRQRNAALKARRPEAEVRLWDEELIQAGSQIQQHRAAYLESLLPVVQEFGRRLLATDIDLRLQQGWAADQDLAASLEGSFHRDVQRGATTAGPHRADLQVRVSGQTAKDRVSRGQQKMLAASLMLAQIQHRFAMAGVRTTLLLDDPAAELDVDNLRRLLDLVVEIPLQLIVTALDASRLQLPRPGRMFHVERGVVEPVLYS